MSKKLTSETRLIAKIKKEKTSQGIAINGLKIAFDEQSLKSRNLLGSKHSRLLQRRALLLALSDQPFNPRVSGDIKFCKNPQDMYQKVHCLRRIQNSRSLARLVELGKVWDDNFFSQWEQIAIAAVGKS